MMTRRKSVHESVLMAQPLLVIEDVAASTSTATNAPASSVAAANGAAAGQSPPQPSPVPVTATAAKTDGGEGKKSATAASATANAAPAPATAPSPSPAPSATQTASKANGKSKSRTASRRASEVPPVVPQGTAQQTLLQNGMDPDEIPKFKGYRIIEIDHFLQWAAFSQFMHSKHCPGGLLKPYQEYISGCYSTFAMKCSKCSAIITRSSENYIHHNKLMNRLVKGTLQMGKDYDEMNSFMEALEIPFVTRDEFQSIKSQFSSSLEDQSALQRAVEELEQSSVNSKRKRHGSCKYHYEVLKVYLNKKMKKIEENLQLSVNDSVALAVNAHLKNVSHVQLVSNGSSSSGTGINGMTAGGRLSSVAAPEAATSSANRQSAATAALNNH